MIEIVVFGRGGQGGVTLAKLVALMHFREGRYVQAFGSYGAERSGAPVKAFIRIDEHEIRSRNQVYEPDHVIVLDPALIVPSISTGLRSGGLVVLNTPRAPQDFGESFVGYRIAAIDATTLAVANALGTRTTPIVNTTMLGAVARVFGLPLECAEKALSELGFGRPNVVAARQAFDRVRIGGVPQVAAQRIPSTRPRASGISILERAGGPPTTKTGLWAKQRPMREEGLSPCNAACPAGNDVRGFLTQMRARNAEGALSVLHETSPFPGICGRVCPAPCMHSCHRGALDEGVNVPALERYVADHVTPNWPTPVPDPAGRSIAVVGSGPAGLSACYQLARLGYRVTLYERDDELGGLLRSAIPGYRLPADVLDREIGNLLRLGVKAHTRARIGPGELAGLAGEFSAVFVGTGLQTWHSLSLDGARGASLHVLQGLVFLDQARRGIARLDGETVLVVGGGNTAVDVARTAIRVGARVVRIVYRRSRSEMPAIPEELEEALEEGALLDELLAPATLRSTGAGLVLRCTRMRLGSPDASGRRRPVELSGPDDVVDLPCTNVILALGSSRDLSILPEGAEIKPGGIVQYGTGPILMGGDLETNDGTVASAIGSGRRAAEQLHAMLNGGAPHDAATGIRSPAADSPAPVRREQIRTSHYPRAARRKVAVLSPQNRTHDFSEVRGSLEPEQAHAEADRCFSCGSCTHCDVCRAHCPEGIVTRERDDYRFDYEYCKGCGICAFECPRGVISMRQL